MPINDAVEVEYDQGRSAILSPMYYPDASRQIFVIAGQGHEEVGVVHGDSWCYDPTNNTILVMPNAWLGDTTNGDSEIVGALDRADWFSIGYGHACSTGAPTQ